MIEQLRRAAGLFLLGACYTPVLPTARAQNLISIDATAPVSAPQPVAAVLGASRNPGGETIGVNSQYLTLNGKPWLPVMGEFHYSRYPEQEWEQEILKMKAAGVNIISTYVIWIHQEQNEGQFDWSGQRDLRRFVELCGRHRVYVFVRIGPWVHAEVRNGGLPDWVLKNGPVRQNDPVYLREVKSFYAQIGMQLQGELWKDGGPVVGLQLENEYNAVGPGKGAEHLRTLKAMALDAGLNVPLYTVTGWDGAAIPLDSVLPVFGGYPDAPWAGTAGAMPANEVYAFRFENRVAGNMGAIGGHGQNAATTYKGTPFLTAEVGDGIEDTYFRRPVVSADDVAAIAPVMLGSGVNMLGYYMFHGGRNPEGGAITLQESQRTGYPTDVPVRSYDFQAPLGEFGQERESLNKLKLVHYFVNDFGSSLAPMSARAPDRQPASPTDVSVPRVAARTLGDAGFVFVSNHVRGLSMPLRKGFQIALKLPGGTVQVPQRPIDLPADAYGIWPVSLRVGTTTLRYSTAQLFKRVERGSGKRGSETTYWFFALPGVQPEFAFPLHTKVLATSSSVQQQQTSDDLLLRASSNAESSIRLGDGVTLIIVPEAEAEQTWRVDDPSLLVRTSAEFFSDGPLWTLESNGNPSFSFGIFGADQAPKVDGAIIAQGKQDGVFRQYAAEVPKVVLTPEVKQVTDAQPRAPWTMGPKADWRPEAIPLGPDDTDFEKAAAWEIRLPKLSWTSTLSNAFLKVAYEGDVARLYRGDKLIDDNFWNGLPWTMGLHEICLESGPGSSSTLQVQILPLPQRYLMYIEAAKGLQFSGGVADALEKVSVVPQYRIVVDQPASR